MPYTIKHWPTRERPRERVRSLGPQALATRELLALIIETGLPPRDGSPGRSAVELAGDLLAAFAGADGEGSLRRIMASPAAALEARVQGIGPAKAAKILAALELGRRAGEEMRPEREPVVTSRDIYERMRWRLRDLEQEEFHLILLNGYNEVLREMFLTRGTPNSSLVDVRDVFRHALQEQAASVVVVHNHPCGEPKPSLLDCMLTRRLVEGGDVMGIGIHDHVIIGEANYYSFNDEKKLRPVTRVRKLKAA